MRAATQDESALAAAMPVTPSAESDPCEPRWHDVPKPWWQLRAPLPARRVALLVGAA